MASDNFKTPSFVYPTLIILFLLITFSGLNDHFGFITFSTILSSQNNNNNNNNTLVRENSETYISFYEQQEKSHVERVEKGLSRARAAIRQAVRTRSFSSHKNESFIPRGSIYKNPSHIEMEKRFRVWAYKEGDFPLFHNGPMKDIYSIEGQFIDELESSGKSLYLTRHPQDAAVFFLPVSVTKTVMYLYRPRVHYQRFHLQNVVTDYIAIVSKLYPYWNRSKGADHFFVGCHDWAPDVSAADPQLYENVIRVLCNANSSEGFRPARDATLPEIKIPIDSLGPPSLGQSPENRSIFAFFAGGHHGNVRTLLFQQWNDKNDDKIQVLDYLPSNVDYFEIMGRTKFCLCPSGWEVASPRLVESIYAGCVPVIISDNYVLPFSDVLDWSKFSVHITVDKIPEIKKILEGISYDEYVDKQKVLKSVQRHFTVHRPSEPYDLLDMVFHSIWLRRLNVHISSKKL